MSGVELLLDLDDAEYIRDYFDRRTPAIVDQSIQLLETARQTPILPICLRNGAMDGLAKITNDDCSASANGRGQINTAFIINWIAEQPEQIRANIIQRVETGELPEELLSLEDAFVLLVVSIKTGVGHQLFFKERDIFEQFYKPLQDKITYRLGGNSTHKARAVSAYTTPLLIAPADIIQGGGYIDLLQKLPYPINVITPDSDEPVPVASLTANNDIPGALHMILEFTEGTTIQIDDKTYTAPRSNRCMPSWNPGNRGRFGLTEQEQRKIFKAAEGKNPLLFISGFQLQTRDGKGGKSGAEYIRDWQNFIRVMRRRHPSTRVIFEGTAVNDREIIVNLMENVFPETDIVSMSEENMAAIMNAYDLKEDATRITQQDPLAVFQGARMIIERSNCKTIVIHTKGYTVMLTTESDPNHLSDIRDSLVTGSIFATTRAYDGDFIIEADRQTSMAYLLSKAGLSAVTQVANSLTPTDIQIAGKQLICMILPNRICDTKLTVGMGDSYAGLTYLIYALRQYNRNTSHTA